MFKEKYTTTFMILIREYLIACPFALRYAKGITTSASKASIHNTNSRYCVSMPVNKDISTWKIDAIAKKIAVVKIIDIDAVLMTSCLFDSLLKNLKKDVSKPYDKITLNNMMYEKIIDRLP